MGNLSGTPVAVCLGSDIDFAWMHVDSVKVWPLTGGCLVMVFILGRMITSSAIKYNSLSLS